MLYTEEIACLPNSFLCFVPPSGMPEPRTRSTHKRIVFGSLNHLPKLNTKVIECWALVLQATPESDLLLQCAAFAEPETVQHVRAAFVAAGAPEGALRFHGPQPFEQAMRRYDEIDIALDPFPYNGGTTTCHALWMGKPVVSLAGDYFCGRMGASLLIAVGASNWIANSVDEYVEIAARLGADLRASKPAQPFWHEDPTNSPLFDLPRYAKNLEGLYRRML